MVKEKKQTHESPKMSPKMSPTKLVNILTIKALASSYETQQEIDEIDGLIHTYKFVDIGSFKLYKKALKDEMKRYKGSISAEYKEFAKQFNELKREGDEKKCDELVAKNKSLVETHTDNEEEHYKNIKAIEQDIKEQFDFAYAIEQLKIDKRTTSFHLQHDCPQEFFKKPWIKGYTGMFYVNFVDLDHHVPYELIDDKDVFTDEKTGELFYRGTRYLDILLCNRGRDKVDETISTVKTGEDDYRIRIKYIVHKDEKEEKKEKDHILIEDNNALYQREQRWLKENTEDFKEQIVLFGSKIVKDVEKTLRDFLISHLSSYFEKENAEFLARSLILEYNNKKVEELFDRLGRLVVFLEEKYMKNEARVFNERLKAGYVRDRDALKFSVTDILQDVYETISIQKAKCVEKIIVDIRKGEYVDIEKDIAEMILEHNDDFDDKYTYSVREIVDKFPRLCKDKYDIDKLNEKIEKSIRHYVKKTIFDLLTLNRLIKSGSIEPFRYTKTYKSLEKLDCYERGNIAPGIGTVFYIENGVVYCFSLSKLLSEGTNINEYTGKPFSPEFMMFLGNLSIPVNTEAEMDMKKDDMTNELLQCFYDDIKTMDLQASELDSEFKNVFLVETDPITSAKLNKSDSDSDSDSESDSDE
jgi:hypothetical protein